MDALLKLKVMSQFSSCMFRPLLAGRGCKQLKVAERVTIRRGFDGECRQLIVLVGFVPFHDPEAKLF
jgi:hypothetical protein